MKIIIPTKGRADTVADKSLRLFPDATLCVGGDEAAVYRKVSNRLLIHPPEVVGIGPLRQWILDNVKDRCVVMVDDDVKHVYSIVGFYKERFDDPDVAQAIVERSAILAMDAGVRVFGFNQAWDVRKYNPFKPFVLNGWTGGVIGIVGRELRYDTSLLLRADIDFCLQSLVRDRIVLIENRYSFVHDRFAGRGGNAAQRSSERHAREIAYLRRKWGAHLDVRQVKRTTRLIVRVDR